MRRTERKRDGVDAPMQRQEPVLVYLGRLGGLDRVRELRLV